MLPVGNIDSFILLKLIMILELIKVVVSKAEIVYRRMSRYGRELPFSICSFIFGSHITGLDMQKIG
jgi:hypothetical protein